MRMLMNFRVLLLVLLLLAAVGCKQGGNDPLGNGFSDDFTVDGTSFAELLKDAKKGNVDAQYYVGKMYYNGFGTSQDTEKALFWYKKSAENDNIESMNDLGVIYSKEIDYIDCEKSLYWLNRAIKLGSDSSAAILSGMYMAGVCVEKDISKAESINLNYLRSDISKKVYEANKYFWIAEYRDYEKAISIATKSFEEAVSTFGYMLGVAYKNGYGVDVDYSKSHYYYLRSALTGNTSSQYNVGVNYYTGEGVKIDKKVALKWVRMAAHKNHAKALLLLGYFYELGDCVEQDYDAAITFYKKAAQLGDAQAVNKVNELIK